MEFVVSNQVDTAEAFWIAHLTDGSTISQIFGDSYATLPRDQLQAFDLCLNARILVRVDLREDSHSKKALIYRRRTQMRMDGSSVAFYIVGFQQEVKGEKVQVLTYIFEDGSILLGGQFREDDELMTPIQPFEWEEDL